MRALKKSNNDPLISIPLGYQDNKNIEDWADPIYEYEKSPLGSDTDNITDVIIGKWTRLQKTEGYSKCEQPTPAEIIEFTSFLKREGLSIESISEASDNLIFTLLKNSENNINWIPATRKTLSEIYLARPSFIKSLRPEAPLTMGIGRTKTKIIYASIPVKLKVLKNIEIPQNLVDLYSGIPTEDESKNTQKTKIDPEINLEIQEIKPETSTDTVNDEKTENSDINDKRKPNTSAINEIIKRAIAACREKNIAPTENSLWETLTTDSFMKEEGLMYNNNKERHEIRIPIVKNKISKRSYSKRSIWEKAMHLIQNQSD